MLLNKMPELTIPSEAIEPLLTILKVMVLLVTVLVAALVIEWAR